MLEPIISRTMENGKIIHRISFKNLMQLEEYLKSDPKVNERVFPAQKSKYMSEEFAGAPYEESVDYLHGGYENNLKLFLELKRKTDNINKKYSSTRKVVSAVVGSRPNVQAYVAGAPKTMYRVERTKEKHFIDVYMNLAYPGYTTDEQILNRGILTLNLLSIFENNDIDVNLRVFEACCVENEIFIVEISLKRPGEIANISRCFYPMCGREFLRRILARVKESMPFMNNRWSQGYGIVLPEEETRELLNLTDKQVLISSPQEMNIQGENIYKDADSFLAKLNLSENVTYPKYEDYE